MTSTHSKMSVQCKRCGSPLDLNHSGPCPKCGQVGKAIKIEISETLELKDSLSIARRREFYETNKPVKNIIIAITILSPCIGLVLSGFVGFLVGLAVGVFSYFLSPYAVIKVRDKERWNVK